MIYYLLAINALAFLVFGFDKAVAVRRSRRVPESMLFLLALAGGTLGAGLAMLMFRHKVSKRSFVWKLMLVIALQLLAATVSGPG